MHLFWINYNKGERIHAKSRTFQLKFLVHKFEYLGKWITLMKALKFSPKKQNSYLSIRFLTNNPSLVTPKMAEHNELLQLKFAKTFLQTVSLTCFQCMRYYQIYHQSSHRNTWQLLLTIFSLNISTCTQKSCFVAQLLYLWISLSENSKGEVSMVTNNLQD